MHYYKINDKLEWIIVLNKFAFTTKFTLATDEEKQNNFNKFENIFIQFKSKINELTKALHFLKNNETINWNPRYSVYDSVHDK